MATYWVHAPMLMVRVHFPLPTMRLTMFKKLKRLKKCNELANIALKIHYARIGMNIERVKQHLDELDNIVRKWHK